MRDLIIAQVKLEAARVGGYPVASTSEQSVERHFEDLALEIPNRLIDTRVEDRLPYVPAAGAIDPVGPREWVVAYQVLGYLCSKTIFQLPQGREGCRNRMEEPGSGMTFIVFELENTQPQSLGGDL
jgi:hypothetical protein